MLLDNLATICIMYIYTVLIMWVYYRQYTCIMYVLQCVQCFFFSFLFLHFFQMTSQSFKEFFAIFTSLLWESFEFHKILYLSSRGTSMGKFKRVNICYRATVFHIPKKTLKFVGHKKIVLILTDKHYFLLTHFVEIINTITRIFQRSFRCAGMHKYILLK